MSGIFSSILSNRNTELELQEVIKKIHFWVKRRLTFPDFQLREFEKHFRGQFGSGKRAVTQAIEKAEANVDWMRKYYKLISEWFKIENKMAQEKEEQSPK